MLLMLIFLLLLLWFLTYQELEGLDEGVDEVDEEEDIIEEGLSIADMNKQIQVSQVLISEPKINILEQLSDKQSTQISDIQAMIATIKTQKLSDKPDNKPPA